MQPSQFIQGAGRHDDLAAVVDILPFGAGHHHDGVASIVFVEAARGSSRAKHGRTVNALHWVVTPVIRTELLSSVYKEVDKDWSSEGFYHLGS